MSNPLISYTKVDTDSLTLELRRIGNLIERWMAWQGIPGGMPKPEQVFAEVSYTDEEKDALREIRERMGLVEEEIASEEEK